MPREQRDLRKGRLITSDDAPVQGPPAPPDWGLTFLDQIFKAVTERYGETQAREWLGDFPIIDPETRRRRPSRNLWEGRFHTSDDTPPVQGPPPPPEPDPSADDVLRRLHTVGLSVSDISGILGEINITAVPADFASAAQAVLGWDPFKGLYSDKAEVFLDGRSLGTGFAYGIGRVGGQPGIMRLGITTEQAAQRGIAPGDEITVDILVNGNQITDTMVFYPDDVDFITMQRAAVSRGVIAPGRVVLDAAGAASDETDFFTSLGEAGALDPGRYLGVPDATPIATKEFVNGEIVDVTYKPTFLIDDKQNDPRDMFLRLAPDAVAEIQTRMARAGLLRLTDITGIWDGRSEAQMALVMAKANAGAYARFDAPAEKYRAIDRVLGDWARYRTETGTIGPAPRVVRLAPTNDWLHGQIVDQFRTEIGRDPSPTEIGAFTTFLTEQYAIASAETERVEAANFIIAEQQLGGIASPADEAAVAAAPTSITDPLAAFRRRFDQSYQGAREFASDQDAAKRVFATLTGQIIGGT